MKTSQLWFIFGKGLSKAYWNGHKMSLKIAYDRL